MACETGLMEVVMLLISSPRLKNNENECEWLYPFRCQINLADESGCTPLHIAVLANKPEIVSLLLNKGADTSLKDASKKTALQYSQDKVS